MTRKTGNRTAVTKTRMAAGLARSFRSARRKRRRTASDRPVTFYQSININPFSSVLIPMCFG
jgi:hypothetical protein